jgi:hypothetical protein
MSPRADHSAQMKTRGSDTSTARSAGLASGDANGIIVRQRTESIPG